MLILIQKKIDDTMKVTLSHNMYCLRQTNLDYIYISVDVVQGLTG